MQRKYIRYLNHKFSSYTMEQVINKFRFDSTTKEYLLTCWVENKLGLYLFLKDNREFTSMYDKRESFETFLAWNDEN